MGGRDEVGERKGIGKEDRGERKVIGRRGCG